jgi:sugar lactone lactonase YvrE
LAFYYLGDGALLRYDFRAGRASALPLAEGPVTRAAMSADGRRLALVDGEGIKMSAEPFDRVSQSLPAQGAVSALLLRPDGGALAFSDETGLAVFQLEPQAQLYARANNASPSDVTLQQRFFPLGWSPDGRWLWVGIRGWDAETRVLVDLPTRAETYFDRCQLELDWLAGSTRAVLTTVWLGFGACAQGSAVSLLSFERGLQQLRVYPWALPDNGYYDNVANTRVSPQGDRFAFDHITRDPDGRQYHQLVLVSADQYTRSREVTPRLETLKAYFWSPDGGAIYYLDSQWRRVDLQSGETTGLPVYGELRPAPDGQWLFAQATDEFALYTADGFQQVAAGAGAPVDEFLGWD